MNEMNHKNDSLEISVRGLNLTQHNTEGKKRSWTPSDIIKLVTLTEKAKTEK